MHRRFGSATLSQLAFLGEDNPNFPREKSHGDNTAVKSFRKKKYNCESLGHCFRLGLLHLQAFFPPLILLVIWKDEEERSGNEIDSVGSEPL